MAMHSEIEVLIVDDDKGVRAALHRGLSVEGFAVREAASGRQALDEVETRPPRAIVLDVTMPGMTGVEVVQRLRSNGYRQPVCILSARDDIEDRVAGLQAGADDYVVKPFTIAELSARIHALVRLFERQHKMVVVVSDLAIDPTRRMATRGGRDLELTTREFDLLLTFAEHSGQVLRRTQLLDQVWGYTWPVETNVVDVFIGYVRKKMELTGEPRMLHNVRGVGFVLRP